MNIMATRRPGSRRARILGGCKTCRRRHVKCDKEVSSCRQCTDKGLVCEGYPSSIRWMPFSGHGGHSGKKKGSDVNLETRYYLYTENARRSMNHIICKSLLGGSVDVTLEQIDAQSENLNPNGEHIAGPFSVLNLPRDGENQKHAGKQKSQRETENTFTYTTPPTDLLPINHSPETSFPADGLLQWSDLFNLEDDPCRVLSELMIDNEASFDLEHTSQASNPRESSFEYAAGMDDSLFNESPSQIIITDVLQEAGFLIRHFETTIISQLTIFSPRKGPWSLVNIPAALETLGQLQILKSDDISHARLANLYSILSCASCHLATCHNTNGCWKSISDNAYAKAKCHMKLSLEGEIEGPRKAKFKDQIMALYGLTECAIFSNRHRDARMCLSDSEYLIRYRGLSKRNVSRKVRLLLNVYPWLRVLGESTYVLYNQVSTESLVEAISLQPRTQSTVRRHDPVTAIVDRGLTLDDFLRFDNIENDLNLDDQKERGTDLRDIHLHDSRKSPESLSFYVYGMSETWLSLVSQTTRFSNAMNALKTAQDFEIQVAPHVLKAVTERDTRLENVIQSFVRRSDRHNISKQSLSNANMIQALNHALVIFFYRRVRKVHPAMLEGQVDRVIAALDAFFINTSSSMAPGPGTLWPLFIAGCEATSQNQRSRVSSLIELIGRRTGIAPFETLKSIMFELWNKQDEQLFVDDSQPLPTWMDLLRLSQNWPIFA